MTDYPAQSGRQRIDVITSCDRCGVLDVKRDCPPMNYHVVKLLLKDGWTRRGTMWRCPDCSPVTGSKLNRDTLGADDS